MAQREGGRKIGVERTDKDTTGNGKGKKAQQKEQKSSNDGERTIIAKVEWIVKRK